MTTSAWVDANVLLRLLTADPPDMALAARDVARRAAAGELRLRLAHLVVAEVVWVLASFYKVERTEIARLVGQVVCGEGVVCVERDEILQALRLMSEKNVDFVDAWLAVLASSHDEPLLSFDTDFDRLPVQRLDPHG